MTAPTLTAGQRDELLLAVTYQIDRLREGITVDIALTASPAHLLADRVADTRRRALRTALRLRHAEHAYRLSGGLLDEYLPACHRTPRAQLLDQALPVPESRSTAGEETAPASRPSPATSPEPTA